MNIKFLVSLQVRMDYYAVREVRKAEKKKRLNYKQHVWDAFILLIYIKM